MSKNIYALLVGIDTYEAPVRPLNGCVNDIKRIEELLKARTLIDNDHLSALVLTNSDATRPAIIDGFREHLGQAKADDIALFYYSGHGSQQQSPPEFWHLEPDRLDETLVCYDSRQPGSWDLADKELAQLIAKVAETNAHIVIILDCCHSGSGTRTADDTGIRRAPTDERVRPLSTFLAGLDIPTKRSANTEEETDWLELPNGRHILLAACRSDEEAKECSLNGQTRGVFSHFLAQTLEQTAGPITYRDLFKRVKALVRSHAALQSPQIEPTDHAMFEENFLGGTANARSHYFTLSYDTNSGWVVDAGVVHGITQPVDKETTVFAIFPRMSMPDQRRSMDHALGTARVQRVDPHRSRVEVDFSQGNLDQNEVYKAILIAQPLTPFDVHFVGNEAGLSLARTALSKSGPTGGTSLLIREVSNEYAGLRLIALESGYYRILRPTDGQQLVEDVEGFSNEGAQQVIARLEHIARWIRIAELHNPTDTIKEKIAVEFYLVTGDAATDAAAEPIKETSLRLAYALDAEGKWRRPKIKVRVINRSDTPLYCALVGLTQTFAVQTTLFSGGSIMLNKGEDAWANAGNALSMEVPNVLWQAGLIEVNDILKLIASTEEIDATLLEQGELDHPLVNNNTRGSSAHNSLNRLMARVQTRAFSTEPDDDETISDWTTQEFVISTVRPLDAPKVEHSKSVELYPGVELLQHPSLDAQVRLTAAQIASRDVNGGMVLPPLLRDHSSISQPFLLSSSRGGAPGLSVLELFNINNPETVTPEQPLRLKIAQPLGAGEHLLPVTYDGEFYLPIGRTVGHSDHIEVVLATLPTLVNTRSLVGAVRIFFQKIISEHFGTEYQYPLLAAYTPDDDGDGIALIDSDAYAVKGKVAQAERIALYIHGIIGETRGMAASSTGLAGPPPVPGLRERYDLFLTFDYENLNTPIEENARLLKQRLIDAGLGPGHSKTVHVIAHSMGGLVARWFIEREGGNAMVQHLVMLGTPNGGSPWAKIEEWALTVLSLGLNSLLPISWPASVLGSLVGAIEKVDVALDQMNTSSDFLKTLNASPDPQMPYTIIAGNTSLLSIPNINKEGARVRLLNRLKSLNLLHLVTAPAFFGESNDIAVSVASIRRQPSGRTPAPIIREVACDHITYFSTAAALNALAQVLPQE